MAQPCFRARGKRRGLLCKVGELCPRHGAASALGCTGHPWGAGLPQVNWRSHACYLCLCSDEGFPLERDMSTHRKPVWYLYHTVHLANMVQKGMAGANHKMSFFHSKIFIYLFWLKLVFKAFGFWQRKSSFFFILALIFLTVFSSFIRGQNIFKYWTFLSKIQEACQKYFIRNIFPEKFFSWLLFIWQGNWYYPAKSGSWTFLFL